MVIVNILAATICFSQTCYPVLVGDKTPTGIFQISHKSTPKPGYGGDILQFFEDDKTILAIHRVWLLRPKEKRLERLSSKNGRDRIITNGCINVDPTVYEKLVDCCSSGTLEIRK